MGAGSPVRARQDAFLAAYAETLDISAAASASQISRSTHYEWMGSDDTYAPRFAAARRQAVQRAEAEAFRRAVHGVERIKFAGGVPAIDPSDPEKKRILTERVYSDELLKFVLRGNDERYREKSDLRLSGPGGGPIVAVGAVSEELRVAATAALSDPRVVEALLVVGEALGHAGPKVEDVADPVNPAAQ